MLADISYHVPSLNIDAFFFILIFDKMLKDAVYGKPNG